MERNNDNQGDKELRPTSIRQFNDHSRTLIDKSIKLLKRINDLYYFYYYYYEGLQLSICDVVNVSVRYKGTLWLSI